MADLARKMPQSSHVDGFSIGPIDLANEKHYSVIEISKLWALSQKTVRRIFEREPSVNRWGSEETRHKRGTGLYGYLRQSCCACIENCDEQVEISRLVPFKRSSPAAVVSGTTSYVCCTISPMFL